MAAVDGRRRAWPLRATSSVALLLALLATGAAAWAAHAVVRDQESRLLKERASEINLVLTSAISAIPAAFSAQGGILKATNGSRSAYEQAVQTAVTAGPGQLTFAWLRPAPAGSGFLVLAAAGPALHPGQVIDDSRVATLTRAMSESMMVATPVFGAARNLGFAQGAPAAPTGTVLYRESALGPLQPPRAAATAPFSELEVAIYGAPTPDPARVLSSTTSHLPLTGDIRNVPLAAGASHWLLSVKARQPLVGGVASDAWWVVLGMGVLGSLLIGIVIETAGRRRDSALALYASEHHVAETLQRSLLPQLPTIAGLQFAARYLAGGQGQEVGGDWFDAFPVSGGRVGIAVGDVIGHDLAAASAMAQIRAALRAYAVDGDPPRTVINRLDHLVDALGLTQLVTVVYGVLDPPAADGSRLLTYTNAGHLAPLVRYPDGDVRPLAGGDSIVIGAPAEIDHSQAEQRLEPGATLMLFTDGLVEVPGRPLEEMLHELETTLAEHDPRADLESMCEQLLAGASSRTLRDDIALLVIRINAERQAPNGARAGAAPGLA